MKLIPKDLLPSLVTWRTVHVVTIGCTVLLAFLTLLALVVPVGGAIQISAASDAAAPLDSNSLSARLAPPHELARTSDTVIRSGFFKSATRLRAHSTLDKTVERIMDSLELKCIMPIQGKLTGFVKIKGSGMKSCVIDQKVEDLFTVRDIDVEQKSMTLDITGKGVILRQK